MASETSSSEAASALEYTIRVCGDDTVGELKRRICEVTNVPPKRQKPLYPNACSKLSDDSLLLSQIPLKDSLKMTMMGTTENDIIVDPVESPEVVDDFEPGKDEAVAIKENLVNKHRLRHRIERYKIEVRNPSRYGKKLLVLDIDHTLFDKKSKEAKKPFERMRPHLHEFLTATYAEYDIIIWSASSMQRIVVKMGKFGVLNNPNYKITALLDHMAMITVQSARGVLDCKPLGLIWALLPEFYNAKNTIMLDDLNQNFVMNPQNGLTIKPYRNAHANRSSDQELVKLAKYLLAIAELDDFGILDHEHWEKFNEDHVKTQEAQAGLNEPDCFHIC